jgi:hypothetical protein
MSWERSVFAIFDDLEQQAEGLALVERDAEVADLSEMEYTQVSLAARLHASSGHDLRVRLLGGRTVTGRLARLGEDWLMLVEGSAEQEWIVRTPAVVSVGGLSPRAQVEDTWSVVDKLSLRAVLRRLSATTALCALHFVDEATLEGRLARVGRDFVEVMVGEGRQRAVHVVPLANLAALQGRQ